MQVFKLRCTRKQAMHDIKLRPAQQSSCLLLSLAALYPSLPLSRSRCCSATTYHAQLFMSAIPSFTSLLHHLQLYQTLRLPSFCPIPSSPLQKGLYSSFCAGYNHSSSLSQNPALMRTGFKSPGPVGRRWAFVRRLDHQPPFGIEAAQLFMFE